MVVLSYRWSDAVRAGTTVSTLRDNSGKGVYFRFVSASRHRMWLNILCQEYWTTKFHSTGPGILPKISASTRAGLIKVQWQRVTGRSRFGCKIASIWLTMTAHVRVSTQACHHQVRGKPCCNSHSKPRSRHLRQSMRLKLVEKDCRQPQTEVRGYQ